MSPIMLAIVAVTAIGLICAVILAIASKVMAVETNPLAGEIRDALPGANCGACGFAGCDGYAAALAAGEAQPNLCIPGGNDTAAAVCALLGVESQCTSALKAVIKCCGDCDSAAKKAEYSGIESCAAAKLYYGGDGLCSFGCIGLGDCVSKCTNDAICIEKGIAHIDTRSCMGCGSCAKVCPNKLILVIPAEIKTAVVCSNTDKGAATRKSCTHGCIGCKKCERECPNGAITVQNNLAQIDYDKCSGCGHCAEICTTGCILKL